MRSRSPSRARSRGDLRARLRSFWRNVVRRRVADRDLEEEISGAHAELTEEYVARGMELDLLLLIGAGLVLRSLDKVRPTRLGFSSENVVVASITLDPARYDRGRSQTSIVNCPNAWRRCRVSRASAWSTTSRVTS